MKFYQQSLQDMTRNANGVLEAVIETLERDEFITPKQAGQLSDYAVVVYEKGLFRRAFDKMLGIEDKPDGTGVYFLVMKRQ